MTPDQLRALADAATPEPWEYIDIQDEPNVGNDPWPVVRTPDNAWIAQGERCFKPETERANMRLIAALGPDAARLLADAMEWIKRGSCSPDEACKDRSDCLCPAAGELLARFERLGEQA